MEKRKKERKERGIEKRKKERKERGIEKERKKERSKKGAIAFVLVDQQTLSFFLSRSQSLCVCVRDYRTRGCLGYRCISFPVLHSVFLLSLRLSISVSVSPFSFFPSSFFPFPFSVTITRDMHRSRIWLSLSSPSGKNGSVQRRHFVAVHQCTTCMRERLLPPHIQRSGGSQAGCNP
jgi:hypothetical protein